MRHYYLLVSGLFLFLSNGRGHPAGDLEMVWLRVIDPLTDVSSRTAERSPTSSSVLQHMKQARLYEGQRQYAKAVVEYRQAMSSGGGTLPCLFLADLYLRLEELNAAVATTDHCIRLDQNSVLTGLSRAYVLQKEKKFRKAGEWIDRLLETNSRNP